MRWLTWEQMLRGCCQVSIFGCDSRVPMPSVKTHWPVWDICALMRDFETNIYASNFWYTRVFLPTVQALISRGWGWGPCLQKLHCLITQMVVEVVHLQWVISQVIPLFWVTPMNCFSGYIDLQCKKKKWSKAVLEQCFVIDLHTRLLWQFVVLVL